MKEIHEKLLKYITSYLLKNGYSPTVREIADGVGYSSTAAIFNHLRDMRMAGLINYEDDSSRTITIPGYRYMKIDERRRGHGGTGKQRCTDSTSGSLV